MPKRSCPKCSRRLPYAARRCVHCEWSHADGEGERTPVRHRMRSWAAALALAAAVGGGVVYQNADDLAYWYADFAARHLPSSLSSWAPTDTDAGAFFYCARQVARRMDGEFSVETFPSLDQSHSVALGQGRWQIESFVEEAREDGARVRHAFICTVQYERGRWVLEDLNLDRNLAGAEAEAASRALGLDRN